jgi:hypothetical protein
MFVPGVAFAVKDNANQHHGDGLRRLGQYNCNIVNNTAEITTSYREIDQS